MFGEFNQSDMYSIIENREIKENFGGSFPY